MYADWHAPYDDGFRSTEELEAIRRSKALSELAGLRLYGPREKYLRQLKRCMKYGPAIVAEAKRIRKWGDVKSPKF